MATTPTLSGPDRLAALWAIYEQLDSLLTPEEFETYPVLDHLGDLLEDLQQESGD